VAEREEFAALVAAIAVDEARYLAPAIDQMQRDEQAEVAQLATAQIRSEALAALVQQHEQLLAEARTWLASFEQRRLLLQDRYADVAGEPFPSEQRR
jgi:Mg/Co/Ni transporter MgtE